MISRRRFLRTLGLALVGIDAVSGRIQAAAVPEAARTQSSTMQPLLHPSTGRPDMVPLYPSHAVLGMHAAGRVARSEA